MDTRYGFLLATETTPASFHDSPCLPLCVVGSYHTENPVKKVFADKGCFGRKNREFLSLNHIRDGIMRKETKGAKPTPYEKERNKAISKIRCIVEQYFGISHLYRRAHRARFTKIVKNAFDALLRVLRVLPSISAKEQRYSHRKGGGVSYESKIARPTP